MTAAFAGVLVGAAILLLAAPGGSARNRLAEVRGIAPSSRSGRRSVLSGPAAVRAATALAGVSIAILLGGVVGVAAGVVVTLGGPPLVARVDARAARAAAAGDRADVGLALELVAACLEAGAPLVAAVDTVGEALGDRYGAQLGEAARRLRMGSAPASVWGGLPADDPLGPFAETVLRVGHTGSSLVSALRRLARDEREETRQRHTAAARRVGVHVVAPLGLCFLPAFALIGVVPIVAGLVSSFTW